MHVQNEAFTSSFFNKMFSIFEKIIINQSKIFSKKLVLKTHLLAYPSLVRTRRTSILERIMRIEDRSQR